MCSNISADFPQGKIGQTCLNVSIQVSENLTNLVVQHKTFPLGKSNSSLIRNRYKRLLVTPKGSIHFF